MTELTLTLPDSVIEAIAKLNGYQAMMPDAKGVPQPNSQPMSDYAQAVLTKWAAYHAESYAKQQARETAEAQAEVTVKAETDQITTTSHMVAMPFKGGRP